MTEQPTHLYHGTTGDVARLAMTEGLRPRNETGAASNWEHTVSSNFDLVYLTAGYAPYFAMASQPDGTDMADQRWAVLEIDLACLDTETSLLPDEDFLEQGSRGDQTIPDWCEGLVDCRTMEERTVWFRSNLDLFHEMWSDSVEVLGTAAHIGTIPPEAISRIGIFIPNKDAGFIAICASDPMISILNYKIMGEKYRNLTRWFVGHPLTPEEFYGYSWPHMQERLARSPDDLAMLIRVLTTHPGLEVIEP